VYCYETGDRYRYAFTSEKKGKRRRGHDLIVVGFTTTNPISTYHH
jgi:hypothetical protein